MKRWLAMISWLWAIGFGLYVGHAVFTAETKGDDLRLGLLSYWPALVVIWTLPSIMFGVLALISDWVDDELPTKDVTEHKAEEGPKP